MYEILAVVSGGVLGFGVTWAYLSYALKEEKAKEEEIRRVKISAVTSSIEPKTEEKLEKPPEDLSEFVDYLSNKYMLSDVTLLTPEGLPVVSNSPTPEEDAAIAPELLKVARGLLNTERVLLGSEDRRILIIQTSPDIIMHARIARDISKREMDRIAEEINMVMEGIL
jgi:hypothetical protein